MPAYIPIPEGFQPPNEDTFELPVMFEMRDGQLYALAVDGMPLPEGEMEDEEMEDEEMEDEEGEMEMEEEPANFMAAVERGMTKR
jgi:hypothetical protein